MRILAWAYCVLGFGACLLVPLNAAGWVGEPDPLSGIFPLLFALPWSLLLHFVPGSNSLVSLAMCFAGIALNTSGLLWIAKKRAARRERDT